jgi:hypothetical protein
MKSWTSSFKENMCFNTLLRLSQQTLEIISQITLPCSAYSSLMMEAVRTSETSVDNHFTRQYNPEDSSEHHTRRRENMKSQIPNSLFTEQILELPLVEAFGPDKLTTLVLTLFKC